MRAGSLYYASDKALFDALKLHKVTNNDLQDLFFKRGVLVSKDTSREELAKYFSRLTHDYYDHQKISKRLGVVSGREKTTSLGITTEVDSEYIEESLNAVCDEINAVGDVAEVNRFGDRFELKIKYKKVDYNKNEFKQVREREATIVFRKGDEGWVIRHPYNEYVEDVKDNILTAIAGVHGEELGFSEITLDHIDDSSIKTKFFIELISSVDGLVLDDVTDVYVYHPEIDDSGSVVDGGVDVGVRITNASLKGIGVNQSEELNSFVSKGYYIWKIVWRAKGKEEGANCYEFEAQFSEPESCRKFSYLAKGYYRNKEGVEFHKNRTGFNAHEEEYYNNKIEEAAKGALMKVGAQG